MLTRSLLERASRGPDGHRALVLTYHRVLDAADPLQSDCPTAEQFERQVAWMARHANVLTVRQLASAIRARAIPPRCICVTFDDGYRDNLELAAPILLKHGIRATFFVATGYLDGSTMWNDKVIDAIRLARTPERVQELLLTCELKPSQTGEGASATIARLLASLKYQDPDCRERVSDALWRQAGAQSSERKMMTPLEVARLSALGMEVGAHTVTHPILSSLDETSARREISTGRATLEQILGQSVTSFAYPNGLPGKDYGLRDVSLVRESGYDVAVSTAWGAVDARADMLQLPRVGVWQHRPLALSLHMLRTFRAERRSTDGAVAHA